ncbi:MAG: FecR domain-containing protein [Tannerellaceae bacterium]
MEKNRAYRILQRLTDRTLPAKHRGTVLHWLAGESDLPEKEEALRQLWKEMDAEADQSTHLSLLDVHRKIGAKESVAHNLTLRNRLMRYAAILLLPLIVGIAVWKVAERQQTVQEMVECYVPNGKLETVLLPDGTRIQINSGSLLIYPREFRGKNRTVYLTGEANFSVSKNKNRPFIVRTGPLKVQVLGTQFNIESYPGNGRIVTTLEEGAVKVYKNDMPEKAIEMKPDEQLTYNEKDDTFTSSRVEAHSVSVWTRGELRFVDKSLTEILTAMERRYNVHFRVSPDVHSSDMFTMKFKQHETIEDVMNIFAQLVGNLSYRIEGKDILLFKEGKEALR